MSHRLPIAVSVPVVLKVSEFIKPHYKCIRKVYIDSEFHHLI